MGSSLSMRLPHRSDRAAGKGWAAGPPPPPSLRQLVAKGTCLRSPRFNSPRTPEAPTLLSPTPGTLR